MDRVLSALFAALGAASLALAAGFFLHRPWALATWPWPTSALSDVFLASIAAAIAAPLLWIARTRDFAAIFGGALNLAVVNAGVGLYAMGRAAEPGRRAFALVCAAFFAACVAQLVWTRRLRFRDERATPAPVRASFLAFAVVLLVLGATLVLQAANVFPWPLKPEQQVLYGWIFVGAAAYFAYGALVPRWANAQGQLWGFLAYDVVLIVPFIRHFATVPRDLLPNLVVYVAVLVYSGGLAVYFLALDPATRTLADRDAGPPARG